jgi:REP element-mobilizing transposase RayT
MSRKNRQLAFEFPNRWGGKRKKAGRKPAGERAGVAHRPRPVLGGREPAHVTLRVVPGLRSLRDKEVFPHVREALGAGAERFGLRLVHFSVQTNHIHLVVEGPDAVAVRRGLHGLTIRLARAINRALSRKGRVFADRYHARPLGTPREVRNALVYVLGNGRKHAHERGIRWLRNQVDPRSSAPAFDGWRCAVEVPGEVLEPVTVRPRTWLLRRGWRRHGLLDPAAVPSNAR